MEVTNHGEVLRLVPGADMAVLMVHGICSSPRHFDGMLPWIPENCSVHNLCLQGHGGDVRDFSAASMKAWRSQVDTALRSLCTVHDRVVLVGYSLGTLLLMEAAGRYPQVKGMLLLNPPLCPRVHPKMVPFSLGMAFGKTNWRDPYLAALCQDVGIQLSPWLPLYLGWIPRFWELLMLCRRCRKIAGDISVPCHSFLGGRDELVSMRSQKYLTGNPHVTVHIMDTAGHSYYPQADVQRFHEALEELLQ